MLQPEDGEGEEGDLPGYTPNLKDLRLEEVYGDWVHAKAGDHLHGGIADDKARHGWWSDLVVMPCRCYNTLSGKVGRRFVGAFFKDLYGV